MPFTAAASHLQDHQVVAGPTIQSLAFALSMTPRPRAWGLTLVLESS